MREIQLSPIYDLLRLGKALCDPKMCVNLCVCGEGASMAGA